MTHPTLPQLLNEALAPYGLSAGHTSDFMLTTATSQRLMQTQQDASSPHSSQASLPSLSPGLLCVAQGHFGSLLQTRQAPLCR